jgi:hypothetical protein
MNQQGHGDLLVLPTPLRKQTGVTLFDGHLVPMLFPAMRTREPTLSIHRRKRRLKVSDHERHIRRHPRRCPLNIERLAALAALEIGPGLDAESLHSDDGSR